MVKNKASPKSWGFILWVPWISVPNYMEIPEIFQAGPQWWTDRPTLLFLEPKIFPSTIYLIQEQHRILWLKRNNRKHNGSARKWYTRHKLTGECSINVILPPAHYIMLAWIRQRVLAVAVALSSCMLIWAWPWAGLITERPGPFTTPAIPIPHSHSVSIVMLFVQYKHSGWLYVITIRVHGHTHTHIHGPGMDSQTCTLWPQGFSSML